MVRNNASTDGGSERETERFSEEVDASKLIPGDRIDKRLVAQHPDQFGSPLRRTMPHEPDEPVTQLIKVTETRSMDDSHTAILFDPETETYLRAGRLDSSQAWSQAEADWTVREAGTEIVVEAVDDLERPEEEQDDRAEQYAQEWVEILFDEIRYNGGEMDCQDEIRVDGSTLSLRDYDGRKLTATISLEGSA